MKIHLKCFSCKQATVLGTAEMSDEGVAEITGQCGHKVHSVVGNPRYEVLFDSACLAIRDEYYREAVASFAAALESFYGYFVQVAARHLLGAADESMERFRRKVKLSERRRGAMELAFLLLTGHVFDPGDDKPQRDLANQAPTKFRNEVVHDGVFPSPDETTTYGRWVFDTVAAARQELVDRAGTAMEREFTLRVHQAHILCRERDANSSVDTQWIGTVLSRRWNRPMSFDDALKDWSQLNAWDLARWDDAVVRALFR